MAVHDVSVVHVRGGPPVPLLQLVWQDDAGQWSSTAYMACSANR